MERMPRLLRRKTVLELTEISESTLYRKIASGDFPASISIGGNSRRWLEDDLIAWLQECMSEST